MVYRFGYDISTINEIALASVAILLLLSGVALELKSTAITGGSLLAIHLGMLIVSWAWPPSSPWASTSRPAAQRSSRWEFS